jgi:hypothetical protein
MYCTACGAQNDDNAYKCASCGKELVRVGQVASPANVPNYLVQSILVTVFCCLPFGIAAIVFASQVNSKLQVGDVAGAMESSRKAKMWSWLAFGVGILAGVIWFALGMLGALAGSAR